MTARRDSLGIQIIESAGPRWTDGAGWRLAAEPVFTISTEDRDSNYSFGRIVSVHRLSSGEIVVGDALSNSFRYFDSIGRYLRTVGRKGRGPGEFEGLSWAALLPGDSLLVWDRGNMRLTTFDARGRPTSTSAIRSPGRGLFTVLLMLPDRRLLASLRPSGEPEHAGVSRDSSLYLRFDIEGRLLDTIGWFPGLDLFGAVSYRPDGQPAGLRRVAIPFSPIPAVAAAPQGFYFGRGDRYEIGHYASSDGRLTQLLRIDRRARPVNPEQISNYRGERLAGATNENARRFEERLFTEAPLPSEAPRFVRLLTDEEQNLWVTDYSFPDDSAGQCTVFDSRGGLLGTVRIPRRFVPGHIGQDFLLGVRTELDETQTVQMFALRKN